MFEQMKIYEKFYGGGTTSKTIIISDANHRSYGSKRQEVESASPTNPKKGFSGKCKKKYADHPGNLPTGEET